MSRIATYPLEYCLILLAVLATQCRDPEAGADLNPEFAPILSANTLDDWEGDPEYWRFENSVLIGEITPQTILAENTFFIWKGGTVADFELKADYRISSGGNSGINYRSKRVEGDEYVLSGYQADIDGQNRYTGQVYEEQGRSILAKPGQLTRVGRDNSIEEIGSVGEQTELSALINGSGWNEYHLVVQGNTLIHLINGKVITIAVDNGSRRQTDGVLGLQLHRGPPMKIEFRNVRLKQLPR